MEVFDIRVEVDGEMRLVGTYDKYDTGSFGYFPDPYLDEIVDHVPDQCLHKEIRRRRPIDFLEKMISEENRDQTRKKHIYHAGPYTVTRESRKTAETYLVYQCGAEKGQIGYSPADHSCPHMEGGDTGIEEWARHYSFLKMDDGTYRAELDEAWHWGGPHPDGGTITREIPEEWFDLPYDEFLENVITLAAAKHYRFTAEELKKKRGLKAFFGYEEAAKDENNEDRHTDGGAL